MGSDMKSICNIVICKLLAASVAFSVSPQIVLSYPPPNKTSSKDRTSDDKPSGKKSDSENKSGSKRKPPKNLAVKGLAMVLKDVEITDMTLDEFAEWLGRKTKANVIVRWKLLEEVGIEPDYPIAIKTDRIRVRDLLSFLFRRMHEEDPSVELAIMADDNTFIISTRADFANKRVVRTYDVQDMLVAIPDFQADARFDLLIDAGRSLEANMQQGSARDADEQKAADELIRLVTTHVIPASWQVNGGKGTIRYFKGRLVVNNSLEVHQLLGGAVKQPVIGP